MSGFGTVLNSVTRVDTEFTFDGDHFSENQFDGTAWISRDGGATKIYPLSYTSWGYTQIVAVFDEADLTPGTYAAGVVSGSDEPSPTLAGAVVVASSDASHPFRIAMPSFSIY